MAFSFGDAVGGGAQGAAAGAQIGGAPGAIVGGAIGAISGGVFGGKSRSAAKRAARAARRIAAMTAFRDKVAAQNSYEAQRAEAVAGAASEGRMNDSSTQGALGAFATQQNAAFGFASAVERQLAIVAKANAKAARYADYNALATSVMQASGSLFKGSFVADPNANKPTVTRDNTVGYTYPPVPQGSVGPLTVPQPPSFFSQDSFVNQ